MTRAAGHSPPARRPLKIFATDPMSGRTAGNRTTLDIANEPLRPGPSGSRLEVVDYDGARDRYYRPVDLDDPAVLMQGGMEPTEADPRFHQQMVYAVGMKVIENFERALGRRLYFSRRLRLLPHAFHGANAFYDSDSKSILFGYFNADRRDAGPNLPGQNVFTCLSHDIIAHEMSHAIVDRLRPLFQHPMNPDMPAFHEAFADLVAIFQHFTFADMLRGHIQGSRGGSLLSGGPLLELAQQFGYATGRGAALRTPLDLSSAQGAQVPYQTLHEPHERGSILVAAVFDAFLSIHQRRIADLLRIATGGTGRLPEGDLHPDLVHRIATEASRTAQTVLAICIRAFEYLPPLDLTFGDFLRALVTTDFDLTPSDDAEIRTSLIEAFRRRRIYPDGVRSLADESLRWEAADGLAGFPVQLLLGNPRLVDLMTYSRTRPATADAAQQNRVLNLQVPVEKSNVARALHAYALKHAERLDLDRRVGIRVAGFHPVFRVGQDGQLLQEVVAQFTQVDHGRKDDVFFGLPPRGGTTVVAGADGRIRYVISKRILNPQGRKAHPEAVRRAELQRDYLRRSELTDPATPWCTRGSYANRFDRLRGFRHLHRERS